MKIRHFAFTAMSGVIFVVLSGCASTGSRSEYFGYNNSPKQETAAIEPAAEDRAWSSPLRNDPNSGNIAAHSRDYLSYGYIPVIVPWWDSYYDWPGFYRPSFSMQLSYGRPYFYYAPYYPWYSPWYDYNPFFGGVCRYPYYDSWRRPWYNDGWRPVVPSTPARVGTRDFGSQRGSLTPASGNNARASEPNGTITTGNRSRTTPVQGTESSGDTKFKEKSGSGAASSPVSLPPRNEGGREPNTNVTRSDRSRNYTPSPSPRPAERTQTAPSSNTRKRNP